MFLPQPQPPDAPRPRGDVTTWSDPAKVALLSGLTVPFVVGWLLRLLALQADPAQATYVSRAFLPSQLVFLSVQVVGHALLIGVALLLLRRRTARAPWLVHAEVQFWFLCNAWSLYTLGLFTSSLIVMLLVLPVVGYLLFDERPMNWGLTTGLVGTALAALLPAAGLAPYAPFLARAPHADGVLEPAWLASQGVPSLAATGLGLVLFTSLLTRFRERQRELEVLSSTDSLTGLDNRRVFFERLGEELARARRTHHAVCVLMVDVDHFKAINDTWGHQVGDGVLRALGAAVREGLRLGDLGARLGGEEVAILLPDTPLEGAQAAAQRLLEAARRIPAGGAGHLSLSVGVAQWCPPETTDGLLHRADTALYLAKRTGRDRACVAPAPEASAAAHPAS